MCTVHSAPVQDSDIWLCTVQRQGLHYKIRLCALPHCCGCTQCSCSSAAGTSPSPQTAFPQHCTALQSDFAGRVWRVGLTICLQMILAVCSVQCAVCSVKRNNVSGYDQATHLATSGSDTAVRALALFANVHLFHNICPG